MSDNIPPLKPQNPLGHQVDYAAEYNPQLLFTIERQSKRLELGINAELPFRGEDIWNAYEISWLNQRGLPQVALAEFRFSANSPKIIESKSFKLYLNSLNQTAFESMDTVKDSMQSDLEKAVESPVAVNLLDLSIVDSSKIHQWQGICLEQQTSAKDLQIDQYQYQPELLVLDRVLDPRKPDSQKSDSQKSDSQKSDRQKRFLPNQGYQSQPGKTGTNSLVNETLFSHLLKSNCLITHQPDWASLSIQYKGQAINHQSLLAYIISFRNHNEFHEQCVERIFVDIMQRCQPQELTVYARYTRRGGLDINPWRSNHLTGMDNQRLIRQ